MTHVINIFVQAFLVKLKSQAFEDENQYEITDTLITDESVVMKLRHILPKDANFLYMNAAAIRFPSSFRF